MARESILGGFVFLLELDGVVVTLFEKIGAAVQGRLKGMAVKSPKRG